MIFLALKFGEATYESVARSEEAEVELEPIIAAPIEVKPPKIANPADLSAFLGQI